MRSNSDGLSQNRRRGLLSLVELEGVLEQHVLGLNDSDLDLIKQLVKLLESREANNGSLMQGRVLVDSEGKKVGHDGGEII